MNSLQSKQDRITIMLKFMKEFKPKNFAGHTPAETAEHNLQIICYKLCELFKISINTIKVDQIGAGFESRGKIENGIVEYCISATLEESVYKYKFEHTSAL